MLILEMILIIIIMLLLILIICGFMSLIESKMLAMIQLRIGPGLLLFGLLTPIIDGIKLFMKFNLIIINVDFFYIVMSMFMAMSSLLLIWYMLPMGYLIFVNLNFSIFLYMIYHMILNIFGTFIIGCFIFCSCFVYLSAMSVLMFNLISEICFLCLFIFLYTLDFYSFLSFKMMSLMQIYMNNYIFFGFFMISIIIIIFSIDNFSLPFDYLECESELVAGLMTEFSGFFFCFYSLVELMHLMFSSMILSMMFFGGINISLKSIFCMTFIFILLSSMLYSMSMSNAYMFMLSFMMLLLMNYLLWFCLMKLIMLLF